MNRQLMGMHLLVWAVALSSALFAWAVLPEGGKDWHADIAPGATHPFTEPWREGLVMPPWGAVLLAPLTVLSDRAATALIAGITPLLLGRLALRWGGSSLLAVPVFLSPFGLWLVLNGQSEWLVLIGLLAAAGPDVVFLTVKPQVASLVLLARFWQNPLAYLLVGVSLLAFSFLIWPGWPQHLSDISDLLIRAGWNWSLFPWSIPVGLFFAARALVRHSEGDGVLATPLLMPYINAPSYLTAAMVVAVRWPRLIWLVWAISIPLLIVFRLSP